MKASNRIILGFLIMVFTTPIFVFMSFRNKINKGEFTVSTTDAFGEDIRKGEIKPFTVLKVIGPRIEGVFTCNIIPAESASYQYANYSNWDSISLKHIGDTLLVKYLQAGSLNNEKNGYVHLGINLYLPEIKQIIAEGVSIFIDTINTDTNPEIYLDLSKRARLTLAQNGTSTSVNFSGIIINTIDSAAKQTLVASENSTGQFNKVFIKSTDADVSFGMYAWIKDLDLQMYGSSTIDVHDQNRIDQLTGFIADSVTVKANWKNIRRLANLTGKLE